jgi:hypothetical protein
MDRVLELVADNVLSEVTSMGQRGRLFGDINLDVQSPEYIEVKRTRKNSAIIRVNLKSKSRFFMVKVEEVF